MNPLPEYFKNASFTMCGAACVLPLVQLILWETSPVGVSHVPGLGYLAGLCWYIFFLWAGLLLRQFFSTPLWWVRVIVLALAGFFLFRYYSTPPYLKPSFMYLAILGFGYLVPLKMLDDLGGRSCWNNLVLLLATVICCIAVSVSQARVGWGDVFGYQYRDMERLIEGLLGIAEPLMVFLVLYFAISVSFSREALWLGGRKWFQAMATVAAAFLFLRSLGDCTFFAWYKAVFFLKLAVQPVSACLLIILVRVVMKQVCREKWADITWEDIFKI